MATVYVIACTQGKFYVGFTRRNVMTRYAEHVAGCGATFTQRYRPLELVEVKQQADPFDEDKMVKVYMNRFGINYVRGGSYANEILSAVQCEALTTELRMANGECIRCGSIGHMASKCNTIIQTYSRIILEVPYSEKEFAKSLGAQWDSVIRKWYVTSNQPHKDDLVRMYTQLKQPQQPQQPQTAFETIKLYFTQLINLFKWFHILIFSNRR